MIDKEELRENLNKSYAFDDNGLITDPTQVKSPTEAQRLYEEGRITPDQVLMARAWNNYQKDGLLDLDAEDANILYNTGLMNQKDADKLMEYKQSPAKYYIKNGIAQVGGGMLEAAQETLELGVDASKALNPLKLFARAQVALKDIEKGASLDEILSSQQAISDEDGETKLAFDLSKVVDKDPSKLLNGVRGMSQFLLPYAGANRALKGVKYLQNPFARSMAAGAAADFTAFDEHEARLSNLIQSMPELANPVTEFLAAQKDDSVITGRLKNVLEGAGLGVAFEGLMQGLKHTRAHMWTKSNGSSGYVQTRIDAINGKAKEDVKAAIETPEAKPAPVKEEPEIKPSADEVKARATDESIPITERLRDKEDFEFIQAAEEAKLAKASVTHEQVLKTADEYAVDLEVIKGVYKDTQNLNAKVVSIGNTISRFRDGLMDEIKLWREAQASGKDDIPHMLELYAKITQHGRMQDVFNGISANIARGLNAHKLVHKGKELDLKALSREELELAVTDLGGTKQLKDAINAFYEKTLQSAKAGNDYSRALNKAGWGDWVEGAWMSGMLSSARTHVANILGNVGMMGVRDLEHLVALTGRSIMDTDLKHFSEFKYKMLGRVLGFADAVKIGKFSKDGQNGAAIKAFMTARPQLDVGVKWMENSSAKIPSLFNRYVDDAGNFLSKQERQNTPIGWRNWLGELGGMWVFRLLTASDEAFKAMSFRGELYRQAIEEMNEKGLKFANNLERKAYINRVVSNPSKAQRERAIDAARRETFTSPLTTNNPFDAQKNPLAHAMAKGSYVITAPAQVLNSWKRHDSWIIRQFAKHAVPFLNTPTNIFKEALRYTPFALFSRRWLEDFMAGGTRKGMALAKLGIGMGFVGGVWELYQNGIIVGKPSKEERIRYNLGNIPDYSIRVGDEWVSYGALEPFATIIGLTVNTLYAIDRNEVKPEVEQNLSIALLGAITDTLVDKSYMKGTKGLAEVLLEPDEGNRGTRFVGQTLAAHLPYNAAIRQGWSVVDSTKRAKETPIDYLTDLFAHTTLEPVLDVFGDPESKNPKYLYAFEYGNPQKDEIKKEMVHVGFNMDPMKQKTLGVQESKFEMPIKERNDVKRIVKELGLKEAIANVINNDSYKNLLLLEDRRAILHNVVSSYYTAAKDIYVYKDDQKRAQIKKDLQDKVDAMLDPSLAEIRNRRISPTPIFQGETIDDR